MSRNRSRPCTAKEASRARFHRWRPDHCIPSSIFGSLTPDFTIIRRSELRVKSAAWISSHSNGLSLKVFNGGRAFGGPLPADFRFQFGPHRSAEHTSELQPPRHLV